MNQPFLIFKSIFSRTIVLYAVIAGGVFLFTDYQGILLKAKFSSLNRLMPAFDYIVGYMEGRGGFDPEKMAEYYHYYQKVLAVTPLSADAQALYGYFSYQLGKRKKAVAALERAAELNPHVAHFYYDLGIISFREGDYARSAGFFEKAVSTDQNLNLIAILNSRLYFPMFGFYPDHGDRVRLSVRRTIHAAYLLALLSYDHLNAHDKMVVMASQAIHAGYDERGEFYDLLGLAAYKLRKYDQAAVFFQQCIEKNPFFEDAFHYLSLSAQALGRKDIAEKTSEKAEALRQSGQGFRVDPDRYGLFIF